MRAARVEALNGKRMKADVEAEVEAKIKSENANSSKMPLENISQKLKNMPGKGITMEQRRQ